MTLIARPRRFGKTLNMSMVEKFFSVDYAGRGELLEGLDIWQEKGYRLLQGTYPVISLSFAKVKAGTFPDTSRQICQIITELYNKNDFLLESDCLNEKEKDDFRKISVDMENYLAAGSLMPCPVICCAIMAKRSSFCRMSMAHPCRRPMCMVIGMR